MVDAAVCGATEAVASVDLVGHVLQRKQPLNWDTATDDWVSSVSTASDGSCMDKEQHVLLPLLSLLAAVVQLIFNATSAFVPPFLQLQIKQCDSSLHYYSTRVRCTYS